MIKLLFLCLAVTSIAKAQTPALVTKVDYKTITWPDSPLVITIPLTITLPGRPKAKDSLIYVDRIVEKDICSNPLLPKGGLPFPTNRNATVYIEGLYEPSTLYLPSGFPVNLVCKNCYIGNLDLRSAQNITLDNCYVGQVYCLNPQTTPTIPISLTITNAKNVSALKLITAVKPKITLDREPKQAFTSLWGYVLDPSIFTVK